MTSSETAASETAAPADAALEQPAPFKTKNLVLIGLVVAAMWAFAFYTGSLVVQIIVGVLTAIVAGVLVWVFRLTKKQRGLVSLLQGATSSPEARRAALAKLEADSKNAGDATHIFARAQLEAADDPAKALETLESLEWKNVPAQMQDDVALLQGNLYLQFGRAKDARPLIDKINVDSSARKQMRGMMVAVVAECWARTGKAADALALLDTVDLTAEKDAQVKVQLMVARVFARFAAGRRGQAREDLNALADVDVNYLGRFVLPQFRVHPELQKLARGVAERRPEMRRRAAREMPQRRGRPR